MHLKFVLPVAVLSLPFCILWATAPARAVTDGSTRQVFEKREFSEFLIRSSIYPKSRHDVFVKEKRKKVPGVNVQQQLIYEPDVYTWELAMAAHRKQMAENPPVVAVPAADVIAPVPMLPGAMPPAGPGQVQLTPLGDGGFAAAKPLPADADAKMDRILQRAQNSGLSPDSELRASQIKQRILDHMNSLNAPAPTAPAMPSNAPNVPILPGPLPGGTPADSFDRTY
ncbi:hypothetical protein KBA41_06700 [Candidatus Ozemobacteraceae bacterium]|nr:hypothetical protein [Candidatus Ozemobacteraceae bacterium]